MKHTRELNLELGWPTVDQALRRLDAEVPSRFMRKIVCRLRQT